MDQSTNNSNSLKSEQLSDDSTLPEKEALPDLDLPEIELPGIKLIRLLGRGGSASVYLGQHEMLQRKVAIKILEASSSDAEKWSQRFKQEAQVLAKIKHHNIVSVLSFSIGANHQACLVMDYVEGNTLESIVRTGGALSAQRAREIALSLADALYGAHQFGVIHRDIKPENIILKDDGTPVLIDFGIAKILDAEASQNLTSTSQLIGSPLFMSPEQASGKALTESSDQYSLAAVLYFMLSGRPVFAGNNSLETMLKHANETAKIDFSCSNDLKSILQKSLSKSPTDRFKNLKEFSASLNDADLTMTRKSPRVRVLWLAFAGLAFAILAATFFLKYTQSDRKADQAESINPDEASLPQVENVEDGKLAETRWTLQKLLRNAELKHNDSLSVAIMERLCDIDLRFLNDKPTRAEAVECLLKMLAITASPTFEKTNEIDRARKRYKTLFYATKFAEINNYQEGSAQYLTEMKNLIGKKSVLSSPKYRIDYELLCAADYVERRDYINAKESENEVLTLLKKYDLDAEYVANTFNNLMVQKNTHGVQLRDLNAISQQYLFWAKSKLNKEFDPRVIETALRLNQTLLKAKQEKPAFYLMQQSWHGFKNKLPPFEKVEILYALVIDDLANDERDALDWPGIGEDITTIIESPRKGDKPLVPLHVAAIAVIVANKDYPPNKTRMLSFEKIFSNYLRNVPDYKTSPDLRLDIVSLKCRAWTRAGEPQISTAELNNVLSLYNEAINLPCRETQNAKAIKILYQSQKLTDLLVQNKRYVDAESLLNTIFDRLKIKNPSPTRKIQVMTGKARLFKEKWDDQALEPVKLKELKDDYLVQLANVTDPRTTELNLQVKTCARDIHDLLFRFEGSAAADKFEDTVERIWSKTAAHQKQVKSGKKLDT